ncbi:unnamed protein product [Prorocentrum cordatum]|uniref:Selenoprotein O n=1 Tax=Prorocentrum cordatum TaxID=2364126 RepID=A0ABN9Q1Z4_9DINO|nr:unnamed protein product [Polarella glacialis]
MAENRPGHRGLTEYDLPGWVSIQPSRTRPAASAQAPRTTATRAPAACSMDSPTSSAGAPRTSPASMEIALSRSVPPRRAQCADRERGDAGLLRGALRDRLVPAVARRARGRRHHGGGRRLHPRAADLGQQSENHNVEMEWLHAALRGQLTEKKSQQSQEYRLRRWRPEGLDPFSEGFLDQAMARQSSALWQAKAIEAGGALHTPLAAEAAAALAAAIDDLLPRMRPPSCDVYFNATGSRVLAGTPPREFVGLLRRQAVEEVQWEALVRAMIADQVRSFYEVGPLKQLKAMMKRIDADAFKRTECIPV